MSETKRVTFEVDALDEAAINEAITKLQADRAWLGKGKSVPDGEGDLRGRILAEICRGYREYQDWFDSHEQNDLGHWVPKG